ncbi:MAG: hypothetical protein ACI4RA_06505, partial [Kiritimatiellia bacterium]
MIELHLDIDTAGGAAFRAEASSATGEAARALAGEALLDAAREVFWYKEADGFDACADDRLHPSTPNLLMFLSDVRGRRFKRGVFLSPSVLKAAELFRAAAAEVAAGRYLPGLEEREGTFFARWRPVSVPKEARERRAFFARCVDGLARRGQRTV